MIQLAIETSGSVGSLAVLSDQTPLKSFPLPSDRRTAATLAVRLQEAAQWCREDGRRIDYVSIARGPGSFTGLRIGLTTAKTYCYATGLPLVAVDSIAAIAALQLWDHPHAETVLVAVNAYRGQVFSGTYRRASLLPTAEPAAGPMDATAPTDRAGGGFEQGSGRGPLWRSEMESSRVLDRPALDELAATASPSTHVAGDPLLFGQRPASDNPMNRYLQSGRTEAIGVGILGHYAATWKQWVDPIELTPRYLKSSAAEEKSSG